MTYANKVFGRVYLAEARSYYDDSQLRLRLNDSFYILTRLFCGVKSPWDYFIVIMGKYLGSSSQ
jgi:hypothetical protein